MLDLYSWQGGTKSISMYRLALSKCCQLWKFGVARWFSMEVGNSVLMDGKSSWFFSHNIKLQGLHLAPGVTQSV